MAARSKSGSGSAATSPKSDAYTGLLLISLLAQLVAVLFFWLDWSQYPTTTPKDPAPIAAGPAVPGAGGSRCSAGPRLALPLLQLRRSEQEVSGLRLVG